MAAIKTYGAIDFSTKHWADQNKWIKMFEIPAGWFPHWHVLDTNLPVHHIACNLAIHKPLMFALDAVHSKGYGGLLLTFDGCFNIRMVRGSATHFSAHSYGLALDLNASLNPLGVTSGGFFDHLEFVKCFTDQGWDWGGNFHARKDAQHYSWAWE
jgi:hypothetical protein